MPDGFCSRLKSRVSETILIMNLADLQNSYEAGSLAEIRKAVSARTAINKVMTTNEVTTFVKKQIEDDDILKVREEAGQYDNTRQAYRENLDFFTDTIKNIILSNGIAVYRQKEDDESESEEVPVNEISREIACKLVGFDCLEDAINDPAITDIYCISYNKIFVERNGKNEPYLKSFDSAYTYKNFVDRLLRKAGKQLDNGENKIVDFEIFGNRGIAIIDLVSTKGISLTLRKHDERPIMIERVINQNLMTQEMADMIGLFIEGETNLIYAGITGSGKTTTIRALLNKYITELNKRALVLEDTQELFLMNPNTVDLKTINTDKETTSITLRDLNIAALRMKPKYIVVGEVRGPEAESAVEGMETGHSTIFTMHGGTTWNVINRLVTKYLMQMPSLSIEVVERIIGSAVHFVCIQDDIPHIGRKITSIDMIGYDYDNKHITVTEVVKYDFKLKDWRWMHPINEEICNTMSRRGVDINKIISLNNFIQQKIEEQKNL